MMITTITAMTTMAIINNEGNNDNNNNKHKNVMTDNENNNNNNISDDNGNNNNSNTNNICRFFFSTARELYSSEALTVAHQTGSRSGVESNVVIRDTLETVHRHRSAGIVPTTQASTTHEEVRCFLLLVDIM